MTSTGIRLHGANISSTSMPGSISPRATAKPDGAGEVFLVEDTTGKGHLSKAIDGKIRNCIFVPIDWREAPEMKLLYFDDYKLGVLKGEPCRERVVGCARYSAYRSRAI